MTDDATNFLAMLVDIIDCMMTRLSGVFIAILISATNALSLLKETISLRKSVSPLFGVDNDRRNFLTNVGTAVAVTTLLPNPAHALGGGIKKVNAKLVQ